jgi:hypothetical protein
MNADLRKLPSFQSSNSTCVETMSVPPKEMLLDDQQTEALERQINGLPATKRARNVFSFATPLDLVIIGISCLAAVVAGGLNPLLTVSILAPISTNSSNTNNRSYMVNL